MKRFIPTLHLPRHAKAMRRGKTTGLPVDVKSRWDSVPLRDECEKNAPSGFHNMGKPVSVGIAPKAKYKGTTGLPVRCSILMLCSLLLLSGNVISDAEHIYSTWDIIELDTCASAWLIKRFVDKKAEFKFYPKGEIITEGVPFDTPDAEFRRYHNMSTFESILQKYKFDNPVLMKMGQILHDIEVNFWGKRMYEESHNIDRVITDIIISEKEKIKCFEKSFVIFDDLYKKLSIDN